MAKKVSPFEWTTRDMIIVAMFIAIYFVTAFMSAMVEWVPAADFGTWAVMVVAISLIVLSITKKMFSATAVVFIGQLVRCLVVGKPLITTLGFLAGTAIDFVYYGTGQFAREGSGKLYFNLINGAIGGFVNSLTWWYMWVWFYHIMLPMEMWMVLFTAGTVGGIIGATFGDSIGDRVSKAIVV